MNTQRKILLSLTMFIVSMFGINAQSANNIYNINSQIHNARNQIERLRMARSKRINGELMRNADYRYIQEHSAEVAELRHTNKQLIKRACAFVARQSNNRIALVAQTPMVFTLYASKYPEVSSLYNTYQFNCQLIAIYERRLEKIDGLEQRVKNHHDSIMHAEIDKYQLIIDSLLNEKMRLIR